jgi:hypothetical protein
MNHTIFAVAMMMGNGAVAAAQQIPVRRLGPAEAVASTKVDARSLVRPLSDGRVIISRGKAVGILGADLSTYKNIADSSSLGARIGEYGTIAIISARGDTTYIVDNVSGGLITIDPAGTPGRTIAIPKQGDMGYIGFATLGTMRTYVDPRGRLIYRSGRTVSPPDATPLPPGTLPSPPADSFPLVRADFESRVVDTVATMRMPNNSRYVTERANDRITSRTIRYAVTVTDTWTMLQDGTIAIVRGADYHVDWIHPDGSRSSSPKMQMDWRRITDEEKTRITDSLQKNADAWNARTDSINRARPNRPSANINQRQEVAPPSTIPDYVPPVRDGSVRADADGNVWILPTTSSGTPGGGLLYDVVNRKGEIFERVQLPSGCSVAGFAQGRVVYITCAATSLERRRIVN